MLRGRGNLVSQVFEAIVTVKSTAIHVAGMPRDEGDESQWPEYEYRSFPFSRRLPHGREKEDTAGAGVFSK